MPSIDFNGIFVPMITPLNPDESLDESGVERLVEHFIAGGVRGIFVLGTSGEGPALSLDTKIHLVRAVGRCAQGRIPVLVGVVESGTLRTIQLAERLLAEGGDAAVITAPYYFIHTQEELFQHFSTIASALSKPLIVYNIPQMVKTVLEPETVVRLARNPHIIGVKDSLGDMARFQRLLPILRERADFGIHQGAEGVAALSIARGAPGATLGLANIAPRLCCDLHQAVRCGDLDTAWNLQERLLRLWQLHTHAPWLPCLKAAASLLGLCQPTASAPFLPLSDEVKEAIRGDLAAAGVIHP